MALFIVYCYVFAVIFLGTAAFFDLALNTIIRGNKQAVYCLNADENNQEYEIRILMRIYPNSVIVTDKTPIYDRFAKNYGRVKALQEI